MGLFSGVTKAIGSVVGGLTGQTAATAATKAGQQSAAAILQGQRLQQKQVAPALRDISTSALEAERKMGSYVGAGQRGLWGMEEQLAGDMPTYTPAEYTAPTAEEVSASPAVQFRMQQAQRALEMGAAARGGLFGGGHQRQLAEQMQGLASQEYETEAERRFREAQLKEQQAQFGAEYGQRQFSQKLAGMQSLAGMGAEASSIASGIRERMGQMKAGIRTGSGAAGAAAVQAAGQARASGALAGSQAKSAAVGNLMKLGGQVGAAYMTGGASLPATMAAQPQAQAPNLQTGVRYRGIV